MALKKITRLYAQCLGQSGQSLYMYFALRGCVFNFPQAPGCQSGGGRERLLVQYLFPPQSIQVGADPKSVTQNHVRCNY
jgi:hypothetical protein